MAEEELSPETRRLLIERGYIQPDQLTEEEVASFASTTPDEITSRLVAEPGAPAAAAAAPFVARPRTMFSGYRRTFEQLDALTKRYYETFAHGPFTPPTTVEQYRQELIMMSEQGAKAVISPTPRELHYLSLPTPTRTLTTSVMAVMINSSHRNACPSSRRLWLLVDNKVLRGIMWDRERKELGDLPALIEADKQACRAARADVRFLTFSVTITTSPEQEEQGMCHMNMLILDMTRDILYHFEPHGAHDNTDVDMKLHAVFGSRFIGAAEIACPSWAEVGPQLPFQGREPLCVLWSILFLESILSVPDMLSPESPGGFADFIIDTFSRRSSVPNPVTCTLLFLYLRLNMAFDWFERELMAQDMVDRFADIDEEQARTAITPEHLAVYRVSRTLPPPIAWTKAGARTQEARKRRRMTYRSASMPPEFDVTSNIKRIRSIQRDPRREESDTDESDQEWEPGFMPFFKYREHGFHGRFGDGSEGTGEQEFVLSTTIWRDFRASRKARVPLIFAKEDVPGHMQDEAKAREVLRMSNMDRVWKELRLVQDPVWGTKHARQFLVMIDAHGVRNFTDAQIRTLGPTAQRVLESELKFELYLKKADASAGHVVTPRRQPRVGQSGDIGHLVDYTMLPTPTIHERRADAAIVSSARPA
jgi:hypothetical protein